MDIMVIVYAILAYLIGSIPSGLIIGKTFFNTDVRQYGSKNIGATNTYRVIGLKAALPVFLCDALKGAAGVVFIILLWTYVYDLRWYPCYDGP